MRGLLFKNISGLAQGALLLALGGVLGVSARAQALQTSGGTNQSIWLSYFADHPVTPRLAIHIEGSYRRTLDFTQFEQYEVRPGITIVEGPHWQTLLAYTYFVSEPTADGTFGPAPILSRSPEHRALEQEIFVHRIARQGARTITLAHRFRLEQRWNGVEESGQGVVNWNFSERARYRLTLHLPLGRSTDPKYYLGAYNEIYTGFGPHGGKSPFYENVDYGALGIKTSRFFSVELGYQERVLAQPSGTTGVHDHSVQVYLLSTLPFRHGLSH